MPTEPGRTSCSCLHKNGHRFPQSYTSKRLAQKYTGGRQVLGLITSIQHRALRPYPANTSWCQEVNYSLLEKAHILPVPASHLGDTQRTASYSQQSQHKLQHVNISATRYSRATETLQQPSCRVQKISRSKATVKETSESSNLLFAASPGCPAGVFLCVCKPEPPALLLPRRQ